jgi:TrfA protein
MAKSENTPRPRKSVDELLASAKARAKGSDGTPSAPVAAEAPAPQLPLWPEPVRAIPNGFLRSALFGAIAKGKRAYIDGERLASLDGVEVSYTGQRLDQGDLDVWASVLHAVRMQALGSQCRVTSYGLLKLMGKTDTGKNRVTLTKRITRLVASAVTIKQGRYSYVGSLIAGAARDEETQEWVIELDAKLRPLFAGDQFTQVEWSVRHVLDGRPLAQWLHGFYATHASPHPLKIDTLRRLCGSEAGEVWKFAQTLRLALDAVSEASAAHGQAFGYEVRGDLVHVSKTAAATQRRHLEKRRPKASR